MFCVSHWGCREESKGLCSCEIQASQVPKEIWPSSPSLKPEGVLLKTALPISLLSSTSPVWTGSPHVLGSSNHCPGDALHRSRPSDPLRPVSHTFIIFWQSPGNILRKFFCKNTKDQLSGQTHHKWELSPSVKGCNNVKHMHSFWAQLKHGGLGQDTHVPTLADKVSKNHLQLHCLHRRKTFQSWHIPPQMVTQPVWHFPGSYAHKSQIPRGGGRLFAVLLLQAILEGPGTSR